MSRCNGSLTKTPRPSPPPTDDCCAADSSRSRSGALRSWDDEREAAADDIIDTVTQHAPNFRDSIIARQIHSPTDLERKFGLVDGDIFHGRMSIDQLWAARPVLGHGDYRSPISGLYLCGAGTHPGGGVTGAPGHNAAREILKDRSVLGRLLRR